MESNTAVIHRGRGIEVFGVLEEWDIVVDGTVVLVVAVAIVDAVVVVVASGELRGQLDQRFLRGRGEGRYIQRRRARMILGVV
jgi:hypothetical protein